MGNSLLTKLTPNSVNLCAVGGKGIADISTFDVAGALAYGDLSLDAYYLGLAKYCMDEKATHEIVSRLKERIQLAIDDNGWTDAEGRALKLASLVVQETGFGLHCKKCNGKGLLVEKTLDVLVIEECKKCLGKGHGRYSNRECAEFSGISKSSWNRVWSVRMAEFNNYISQLDFSISNHLKYQFKSD